MRIFKYVKFEHILIALFMIVLTLCIYWFKDNEKIVNTILVTITNSMVFSISKFFEIKEKANKIVKPPKKPERQ